jgi:hypothetical protein
MVPMHGTVVDHCNLVLVLVFHATLRLPCSADVGNSVPSCIWQVKGGREGRQIGAYELSKAVEELGAGEILLNCIDCDGRVHLSPSTFGYLTHSSAWQWWVLQ